MNDPRASVVILSGPYSGRSFTLRDGPNKIGRGSSCDISVNVDGYPKLSREHAILLWNGRELIVEDTKSTNGVWIGDRRISRETVRDGDTIRFGDLLVRVTLPQLGHAPANVGPVVQAPRRAFPVFQVLAALAVLTVVGGGVLYIVWSGGSPVRKLDRKPDRRSNLPDKKQQQSSGSAGDSNSVDAQSGAVAPSRDLVERWKSAVVYLDGFMASGSGFVVADPPAVVTARHCIEDDTPSIYIEPGSKNPLTITSDRSQMIMLEPGEAAEPETGSDVGLIRLTKVPTRHAFSVGDTAALSDGEEVYVLGFPAGSGLAPAGRKTPQVTFYTVHVQKVERVGGRVTRLQLGGATMQGVSGGPVLDRQGEVVGVLVSSLGHRLRDVHDEEVVISQGIDFSVPSDSIKLLLDKARRLPPLLD